jgi:hypothetical protein
MGTLLTCQRKLEKMIRLQLAQQPMIDKVAAARARTACMPPRSLPLSDQERTTTPLFKGRVQWWCENQLASKATSNGQCAIADTVYMHASSFDASSEDARHTLAPTPTDPIGISVDFFRSEEQTDGMLNSSSGSPSTSSTIRIL